MHTTVPSVSCTACHSSPAAASLCFVSLYNQRAHLCVPRAAPGPHRLPLLHASVYLGWLALPAVGAIVNTLQQVSLHSTMNALASGVLLRSL